jgi:predicted transcriptional regulator with HTH domain
MPRVSQQKRDKISEQILYYLFSISPEAKFTSEVSGELARDEEFTKSLLLVLKEKKLVIEVNKNKDGLNYLRRQRWRLSDSAFEVYKKHQSPQSQYPPQSQQNLNALALSE